MMNLWTYPRKGLVALFAAVLVAGIGLFFVPGQAPAEVKPSRQDRLVAQVVCELLKRGHLSKPEIGDELSKRLFRRYLKDLDPNKLYLLKSDVEEFKKQETELDDELQKGDLDFAVLVYDRFLTRAGERQKLIEEFVNGAHDYTAKEQLETDGDALAHANGDDEIRERWRKRIKFDLLMQRVGEKAVPEAEAKKKVLERYQSQLKRFKQLDSTDVLELYLAALSAGVDPHTTYMAPATVDDFEIALRLNLDGIGAVLRSENGKTIVEEVVPGGAAATDGRLKPKDTIVAVAQEDGKFVDALDMKLRDVVRMIRGARGTKVQLKVVPAGKIEPTVYELTRKKVELKGQAARGDIVEQGKKADGKPYRLGVIDLPSFYADNGAGKGEAKSATEDVRKILKEFDGKGVDGVVLDLRRNGGGLLTEALSLTGLFIDQGPVVQVKDSRERVERMDDPERGMAYSGPLMVLVSRFSASASEILAGALQDYGRAVIVGDSATHGKGTVQAVRDLGSLFRADPPPKLGALKLTIQQFYRVNGESTQARGVESDVVVPSFTEHLGTAEKDMDHALPFDKVKAANHDNLGLITAELKARLREQSERRVKESSDFAKLAKEVEAFKARKARKAVTLNEKELREQLTREDADKLDEKANEALPKETSAEGEVFKFKRNYVNDEVLRIMADFVQAKNVAGR
jgi:carboxyl-terminal processing protease